VVEGERECVAMEAVEMLVVRCIGKLCRCTRERKRKGLFRQPGVERERERERECVRGGCRSACVRYCCKALLSYSGEEEIVDEDREKETRDQCQAVSRSSFHVSSQAGAPDGRSHINNNKQYVPSQYVMLAIQVDETSWQSRNEQRAGRNVQLQCGVTERV